MDYSKFSREQLEQMLREAEPKTACKTPNVVWEQVREYGLKPQEHFFVALLDGAHQLIKVELVTVGLVNRTLVHPREVLAPALINRATAIILLHNHPSGNLEPSTDDIEVTQRMKRACTLMGIDLLDHIIFSATDFYSMCEHGEIA